jgi:hypothetical protein
VITLHAVAGLFALYMLLRHAPGALALLRRRAGDAPRPPMAIVSAVNVVLALAILAVAVRGLVAALLRR